jgi:hypothetical protein
MQEIWRNFLLHTMQQNVQVTLTRLERLVICLSPSTSGYGMSLGMHHPPVG